MERYFWEWEPFEPDFKHDGECDCSADDVYNVAGFDYAIFDARQGSNRPIARALDADQANRIVALLNAAEAPKPQAKPRSRARAPIDDIFA